MTNKFLAIGIGEILWDVFPKDKFLGGAPANFAFHCQQLGAKSFTISSIGTDELGQEILGKLQEIGLSAQYIIPNNKATGTVEVTVDSKGIPTYQINQDVAWDNIIMTKELEMLATKVDAVCFGSLAQRSVLSRQTIQKFLELVPATALKIFDINLRQSFYSFEIIKKSLEVANILKLNDEELALLEDYFELKGEVLSQLQQLREKFNLKLIVFTRGSQGSLLISEGEVSEQEGLTAKAGGDTVGAGDSFTASLCMALLQGWSLETTNLFANRIAAYVCSKSGATPKISQDLKEKPFK